MRSVLAKTRIYVKKTADAKNLTFLFYDILNIVNRRFHLPHSVFTGYIKRSQSEQHIEKFMDTNGVFVDVGANIGIWTQKMAEKGLRVYAFEPSPRPFHLLKNMSKKHKNITALPYALGDGAYEAKLSLHYGPERDSLIGQSADFTGEQISIKVRMLDSFKIEKVGLIKIDTEGYEVPVLMGARETIRRWKPRLVIEVHAPYDEQKVRILKFLRGLDYHWIVKHKPSGQPHIIADPN
jgi:FkbM family methyltransferase